MLLVLITHVNADREKAVLEKLDDLQRKYTK